MNLSSIFYLRAKKIFCFFFCLILFLGILPTNILATSGVCSDTSTWGVHYSLPEAPAGLIVKTENEDHSLLGGIPWTLTAVNSQPGYDRSIYHMDDTTLRNMTRLPSVNFVTGNGPEVEETNGAMWCAPYTGNYNDPNFLDNYKGYNVLGFGRATGDGQKNTGNHYVLSCKQSNSSGGLLTVDQQFSISNLPNRVDGRDGTWTGTGISTPFTVLNGSTKEIVLTWHPQPVPVTNTPTPRPTATPTPRPTVTPRPSVTPTPTPTPGSCPVPAAIPTVTIDCPYCQ